jgi:hypothetical protein
LWWWWLFWSFFVSRARPKIPDDGAGYELLNSLLSTCWMSDPTARPSAESLLALLTTFQAGDLPNDHVGMKKNGTFSRREFISAFSS